MRVDKKGEIGHRNYSYEFLFVLESEGPDPWDFNFALNSTRLDSSIEEISI